MMAGRRHRDEIVRVCVWKRGGMLSRARQVLGSIFLLSRARSFYLRASYPLYSGVVPKVTEKPQALYGTVHVLCRLSVK